MENRRLKNLGGIKFRLTLTFVALLTLLQACGSKNETPAGILSQEQMVSVLRNIYISEEKVNRLTLPRDSALVLFGRMEDKVFETTGVTDSAFEKSLNYYFEHPEDLQKIYAAVVDSLQLQEQRTPIPK
jgi:hypothetical protein